MNLLMDRKFKDYKSNVLGKGASSTVYLIPIGNERRVLKRIPYIMKLPKNM